MKLSEKGTLAVASIVLIQFLIAYYILDNSTIFWGVFIMLWASNTERRGLEKIKELEEEGK